MCGVPFADDAWSLTLTDRLMKMYSSSNTFKTVLCARRSWSIEFMTWQSTTLTLGDSGVGLMKSELFSMKCLMVAYSLMLSWRLYRFLSSAAMRAKLLST